MTLATAFKEFLVLLCLLIAPAVEPAAASEKKVNFQLADVAGNYRLVSEVEGTCGRTLHVSFSDGELSFNTVRKRPSSPDYAINQPIQISRLNNGPEEKLGFNGLSGAPNAWVYSNYHAEGDKLKFTLKLYTLYEHRLDWSMTFNASYKDNEFSYRYQVMDLDSDSADDDDWPLNSCIYRKVLNENP